MINVAEKYNVSRETISELETFQKMVLEWNNKFNLISKSSEKDVWQRHIIDSLQLQQFINSNDKILYDMGSGAGFPALVLAIIGKEKFPNLQISLIESIGKKVIFLNEVKNTLNLNINVIQDRIENLKLPKADIITSRALASLDKLLKYAFPFCNKNTKLVFPKGEKWQEEIATAQKEWNFDFEIFPSQTSQTGKILYIKNIRRK